jgi:eukaryotic-like serine/threonine-protein kinase
MTDRWQQIEKLYHSALELDRSRRKAFLDQACSGDGEPRREVESLLACQPSAEQFIEAPALEVTAKGMARNRPQSFIGQQICSYQILSLLGTGGMGEVYHARDTRLKRTVAIKVLPSNQMSDPERKKRFIQEARSASVLNHPNIITIYDIGSENGIDFMVMEYVQGKTLDLRIPRKGMRLNEALKLAIQIADALAKAHSAGIVHRDLKPSNLMVLDDGLVKVLDFGLAKLTEVGSGTGETLTLESLTEEGMIAGTISYMSPEQAEGKKVDARSDIFSFGSVLYEMLSGQKAFAGHTKMSTLAAVVKQEPKALSELVPDIPPELGRIINRCLRKDPGRRFHHMEDLKVELEELKEESDAGKLTGTTTSVQPGRRNWLWVGAAIVVATMAAGVWLFRGTPRKPQAAPEVVPLTSYPGGEGSPSFSPDGNQVAFTWNGEKQDNIDIYIKLIGSSNYVRLTTDPADDYSPAFSPDGRSIGFVRVSKGHGSLIVIPAIGGPERLVAEVLPRFDPIPYRQFDWLPNGKWVVTDGLSLLSMETGETRSLTSPLTKSESDFSPAVSPDGQTVAFVRGSPYSASAIYLLALTEDLKPKGEPRRLASLKGYYGNPVWTPNGLEIIFASGDLGESRLWRVRASGSREPEQLPFAGTSVYCPAISRNGNRLAYQQIQYDINIWRLSLSGPAVARGRPVQFVASTQWEESAQYSPDGKRIAFESRRTGVQGIWISDADGSHAVELFSRAGASCGTPRWSPDGQRLAFDFNPERNMDIYVIRASGGKPISLTTDSANDSPGSWSRDGKWVYFASGRTGRFEVWKVPAGGGEAEAVQVTRNGGETAFESLDGKSLYYTKEFLRPSALWKMPLSGGAESQVLPSVRWRGFTLTNDGIYFVPEQGTFENSSIQFLSFATNKVNTVIPMSGRFAEGLSVSPDGRFLLFSQFDQRGTDLMLVENFR